MKGYDLLRVIGEIDVRYVEELLTWHPSAASETETQATVWETVPVEPETHSVPTTRRWGFWAAFAASAACLTLAVGILQKAVLYYQTHPQEESSQPNAVVTDVTTASSQSGTSSTTASTTPSSDATQTTTGVSIFETTPISVTNAPEMTTLVTTSTTMTTTEAATTTTSTVLSPLTCPDFSTSQATTLSTTSPLQVSSTTTTITSTTATGSRSGNDQVIFNIKQLPYKTVYQIGEALDLTGGTAEGYATIGGIHFDAFTQPMTYYTVDDSDFDSSHAGTYEIRLTWYGVTRSFDVTVTDAN